MALENQDIHRKSLAGDLKDLRKQEDGRRKARTFLEAAKQTRSYQTAKVTRIEDLSKRTGDKDEERSDPNKEDRERMLVDRVFELIKTHPGFDYMVTANGMPFGADGKYNQQTWGWKDLYFDKDRQEMALDSGNEGYAKSISNAERDLEENTFFQKTEDYSTGGRDFRIYQAWVNFTPPPGNEFTTEKRGGLFFSFALRCLWDAETFDSIEDEDLKDYLLNPDTEEATWFFWLLGEKCNSEWVPEYWNFIKEITRQNN